MTTPGTTAGPASDGEIRSYVAALGLPGLADIHVHFMPEPMQRKVWAYFDGAQEHYGQPWPITYRADERTRLDTLRSFGLRAIPALTYPHKPGMAVWLNDWCRDFAARIPDAVHCATLYPEPGAGDYVAAAITAGARLFKMHVQVGGFSPDDALLDPAWAVLADHGVPVVIHAGSAPIPGAFTGPGAVGRVLARHPDLVLVVAHLGMPEYDAFADLAEQYPGVHLDTTMSATDFTNAFAPLPAHYPGRLAELAGKVVLGSDFPAIPYPYAHQLQALARLGLGDEWMRKVLWVNGARLLGLDITKEDADMAPSHSEATVTTGRPARYGKQLVAHLGRKNGGEWADGTEQGWIQFADGRADVSCAPDALRLRVTGEPEALPRLEDVVGRHLVRFGSRDELVVRWQRDGGEPGTEQRNTEPG